jgi:hypothetical protein
MGFGCFDDRQERFQERMIDPAKMQVRKMHDHTHGQP